MNRLTTLTIALIALVLIAAGCAPEPQTVYVAVHEITATPRIEIVEVQVTPDARDEFLNPEPTPTIPPDLLALLPTTPPEPPPYPSNSPTLIGASHNPQVLVFHGPRCGICEMIKPAVYELEAEFGDEADFLYYSVASQDAQGLVRRFGVRGIPHIILLDAENEIVQEWIGGAMHHNGKTMRTMLDEYLDAAG